MSGDFPDIKSKHSLVAKHVTKEKWDKLGPITTKTSGFTLAKAIACAVEFDNQARRLYSWITSHSFNSLKSILIEASEFTTKRFNTFNLRSIFVAF